MAVTKGKRHPGFGFKPGAWGCLVSSGDEAKAARRRGASWLVASHAGTVHAGCTASVAGLLPYADANGEVLAMAGAVLTGADGVPVLAGILAIDQFRRSGSLLSMVAAKGYAGIQTFPSVGILREEGEFRRLLDGAGLGREREMEVVRLAAGMGLYAGAIAFTPEEAGRAAAIGAHMTLVHLPLADDGGQRRWTVTNRKLIRQVVAAAGRGMAVAGFVAEGAVAGADGLAEDGALVQYESPACVGMTGKAAGGMPGRGRA